MPVLLAEFLIGDTGDLAKKSDLRELRSGLQEIESGVRELEASVREEIGGVRGQVQNLDKRLAVVERELEIIRWFVGGVGFGVWLLVIRASGR